MEVKRVIENTDIPFVTITLTKKEADVLKRLVRYNIDEYIDNCGFNVFGEFPANDVFAGPLYRKLKDAGV